MQPLIPIFAWFAAGWLMRRSGIVEKADAGIILRIILFATLPALAFTTISATAMTRDTVVLPVAGFLVNLVCACIAMVYARIAGLAPKLAGSVFIGASIANLTFMFPFILAAFGPSALANAVLYDVGNAFFLATVAYAYAGWHGSTGDASVLRSVARLIRSPLLLAVMAAVIVSSGNVRVPEFVPAILEPLGAATMPLILIALGMSFSLSRLTDAVVLSTVGIRMLGGLLAGLLVVSTFSLRGEVAAVIIAASLAPIGFNAMTLASAGNFDTERVSASLSVSVALGLLVATGVVVVGTLMPPMAD